MKRRDFLLQAAASAVAGSASAQDIRPADRVAPGRISTARRTAFDPPRHGFQFANDFSNDVLPELDIRTAANVNRGERWVRNSQNDVALPLPPGLDLNRISGIILNKESGGGDDADNWNLDAIIATTQDGGVLRQRFYHSTGIEGEPPAPLFRFTGRRRIKAFLF